MELQDMRKADKTEDICIIIQSRFSVVTSNPEQRRATHQESIEHDQQGLHQRITPKTVPQPERVPEQDSRSRYQRTQSSPSS